MNYYHLVARICLLTGIFAKELYLSYYLLNLFLLNLLLLFLNFIVIFNLFFKK